MTSAQHKTLQGKVAVVSGSSSDKEAAEEVLSSLHGSDNARIVQADLATQEGPYSLIEATVKAFGRLDILVNNAAVCWPTPIDGPDDEQVLKNGDDMVTLNGRGTLLLTRAALPAYTRCWAKELPRKYGCTVDTIAPGPIATKTLLSAPPHFLDEVMKQVEKNPVESRLGTPGEVAYAVAMLCEEKAGWINGQYIPVCGGSYMT
ncbi:hypothetical protein EDB80DRAFT_755877 [Ilyonectria destructans]|nr:hypothetical protein EDB80DRAFT_755877 [Ilyonectria destructans]